MTRCGPWHCDQLPREVARAGERGLTPRNRWERGKTPESQASEGGLPGAEAPPGEGWAAPRTPALQPRKRGQRETAPGWHPALTLGAPWGAARPQELQEGQGLRGQVPGDSPRLGGVPTRPRREWLEQAHLPGMSLQPPHDGPLGSQGCRGLQPPGLLGPTPAPVCRRALPPRPPQGPRVPRRLWGRVPPGRPLPGPSAAQSKAAEPSITRWGGALRMGCRRTPASRPPRVGQWPG